MVLIIPGQYIHTEDNQQLVGGQLKLITDYKTGEAELNPKHMRQKTINI